MTRRCLHSRFFVVAALMACVAGAEVARAPNEPSPATAAQSNHDPSQWRRIALSKALDAAGAIDDPYRHAEAFASIARVQMLVEDSSAADRSIHQALAAAQRVAEPAFRGWALSDIVLAQIDAEDLFGARQTAGRIKARRPHGAALAALAAVQLRADNLAGAYTTAKEIRDPGAAGEVLRQIVAIRSARGELDAARETLRDIHDSFYRALALADVAVAEVRSGRIDRANALAARARRSQRAQVYGRIALARADAADLKGAAETLQEITDRLHRAAVQGHIAAGIAVAGNASGAQEAFASAIATAEGVSDEPRRRAMTFAQLARMQVAGVTRESARRTLQRAQRDLDRLEPGEQREEALDYIGRSQMLLGDAQGALDTAARMSNRIARALLVRDVVTLQADITAGSALVRVAAFDDPLVETAALFGVLGAQLRRSGRPGSRDTIDAARAAVRRIDDVQLQPAAFSALAAARASAGDIEAGRSIFDEALAAAESMEQRDQRAAAYVRIVDALDDRLMFLGRPAQVR